MHLCKPFLKSLGFIFYFDVFCFFQTKFITTLNFNITLKYFMVLKKYFITYYYHYYYNTHTLCLAKIL